MTGWKPIASAPRETGTPLLLYPHRFLRGSVENLEALEKLGESLRQSAGPTLDLSDPAVRRMIKLAKRHGYVTYAELNNLLCSGGFSREQIEDVLHQFAEMGIDVTGAEEMPEDAQPRAPMPERDPGEQARAAAVYAEALKAPWVAYGNVF
jgi:RNA polymerase primary sigma factor